MQRWLSEKGYVVKSTLLGEIGVELAKTNHFDLILLDYNLKKERGGEKTAYAYIPQLMRVNPLTPIVVTSATVSNLSASKLGVSNVLIINRSFWKRLLELVKETLNN